MHIPDKHNIGFRFRNWLMRMCLNLSPISIWTQFSLPGPSSVPNSPGNPILNGKSLIFMIKKKDQFVNSLPSEILCDCCYFRKE